MKSENTQSRDRAGPGSSLLDFLLRWMGRLLLWLLFLLALIFFVALVMEMGRRGGVDTLASAVPSAASFTAGYLEGLLRGDLGEVSLGLTARPVTTMLRDGLPKSLALLGVSLLLATLLGLGLGIGAAIRRHSRLTKVLLLASTLGISTPSFFAAMLLIWFEVWLYRRTLVHLFPISGFGWDLHLLLPSLVLAARPAAVVTRLGFNALTDILGADHVRTARGKGLRPLTVIARHVLRNAGVPILTTIGVSLRFSLASLPIVEYIFNWPGIGRGLLAAIQAQDTNGVVGMILPLMFLFALVNTLLDILYPALDPRLRESNGGAR